MTTSYEETITLPRAVRFPVELRPPRGFDPERLETWPDVPGRLEYLEGRLLFMPPCGDEQQDTVTDVVITLGTWVRAHRDFVLGTNEAGMRLNGATRAADAAIWLKSDAGPRTGGLRRRPPVLAVEVAGEDESEEALRAKAAWYLDAGVARVWLVVPSSRTVIVVGTRGESRHGLGDSLPPIDELPGLSPSVSEFFVQLEDG
jgi:Uma2 family endonuclease